MQGSSLNEAIILFFYFFLFFTYQQNRHAIKIADETSKIYMHHDNISSMKADDNGMAERQTDHIVHKAIFVCFIPPEVRLFCASHFSLLYLHVCRNHVYKLQIE